MTMALSHTFQVLERRNQLKHRKLGRVHFHSLEYHLVVVKEGSGWDNGLEAVVAGSLDASVKVLWDRVL